MIIRAPSIRIASLAAVAAAVGLVAVSPGWSSCPPMGGKPGSQGGNSGSGGGDTGAANAMRREAGDLAGQGSNNVGNTSSGGSGGSSTADDVSGVINALSGEESANDAAASKAQYDAAMAALNNQQMNDSMNRLTQQADEARRVAECQQLSALLSSLNNDPSIGYAMDPPAPLDQITGLQPAAVDNMIKTRQSALDQINAQRRAMAKSGAPLILAQDPVLDWLLRYRLAQLTGFGMEEAKNAYAGNVAAGKQQSTVALMQADSIKARMASRHCT